jgi:hypothetical protein
MRALSTRARLAIALLIAGACNGGGDDAPAGASGGGMNGGAGAGGGAGTNATAGSSGTNAIAGSGGAAGTSTSGDGGAAASSGTDGGSGTNGASGTGGDSGTAGVSGDSDGGSGTGGASGIDGGSSGVGGGDPNIGMLFDNECTLDEQWQCRACADQDESCLKPELTNNGDGTISSACCGHVWQAEPAFVDDPENHNIDCDEREGDPGCFTWDEAHAYCEGLELAGGGFRLPIASEIQTLFVRGMGRPYIDREAFPSIPTGDLYWTASGSEESVNEAWCAGFNGTFSGRRQKNTKHFALCIR